MPNWLVVLCAVSLFPMLPAPALAADKMDSSKMSFAFVAACNLEAMQLISASSVKQVLLPQNSPSGLANRKQLLDGYYIRPVSKGDWLQTDFLFSPSTPWPASTKAFRQRYGRAPGDIKLHPGTLTLPIERFALQTTLAKTERRGRLFLDFFGSDIHVFVAATLLKVSQDHTRVTLGVYNTPPLSACGHYWDQFTRCDVSRPTECDSAKQSYRETVCIAVHTFGADCRPSKSNSAEPSKPTSKQKGDATTSTESDDEFLEIFGSPR